MMSKRRAAFTLVELLVVIGIIAVLAAIIFAVFQNERKRSLETTCISNLRQLGIALRMYHDDYETFPDSWYVPARPKPGETATEALAPYLKNHQVMVCPAAPPLPKGYVLYPPYQRYSYIYQLGELQDDVLFPVTKSTKPIEPNYLLTYCTNHSNNYIEVALRTGEFIGLRTDGSVASVPWASVLTWYHTKSGWTQKSPDMSSPTEDRITFFALPGDDFPPQQ